MSLETWLAEWIITKPSSESLDERNSKPQLNLLKTRFCMFYQGRDVAVCVGGPYWFGKYYDGRSPGFLFIITAMSPPFCAGIPGNYNTSNWCFNSSGQHRQVNVRLLTEIRSRSGLLQISLSCQPPHCPFICLIFYPSMQERQPFYQDTF